MKKTLMVIAVALGLVVWAFGPAIAAFTVHNSDIATGAVDSRTIANHGVTWSDLGFDSISSALIQNGGVGYEDLSSFALKQLQRVPVRPGATVSGVIGGDVASPDTGPNTPCPNNCDWGGYASLPFPASSGLSDTDVLVDNESWATGGGQTLPTLDTSESASNATCTGTAAAPTAPAGKVCIYIAGGDNAVDVKGVSVMPGTGTSPFGFKIVWVSTHSGDSFIDAVWAYTAS